MAIERKIIRLNVFEGSQKYELQTYEHEYHNLMVLLYDKIYMEGFGECKGMGRCGTCAIKIDGLPAAVNSFDRNEKKTLSASGVNDANVRLSCQILVDSNLENATVEIIGDG